MCGVQKEREPIDKAPFQCFSFRKVLTLLLLTPDTTIPAAGLLESIQGFSQQYLAASYHHIHHINMKVIHSMLLLSVLACASASSFRGLVSLGEGRYYYC